MIKLNGKYTCELGFDLASMIDPHNIECGLYKDELSILVGLKERDLEIVGQNCSEYCNLYIGRELTTMESKIVNDLKYIKETFSEDIYKGLRLSLESDIDEETRNNTIFYTQYITDESRYVLYHIPKVKTLTKESK